MNAIEYQQIIRELFVPILLNQNFALAGNSTSGKAYSCHFLHPLCKINLTYEPGADYFDIFVYTADFNPLKHLDDPCKNLRLSSLRKRYKDYLYSNALSKLRNSDNLNRIMADRNLIKAAKDFEIILPLLMRDLERKTMDE